MLIALLLLAAASGEPSTSWPTLSSEGAARAGGGEGDAAVVVGIGRYAQLPEVPGAAESAAEWGKHFVEVRGVPVERVAVLTDNNAGRQHILGAINGASSAVRLTGRVWIVLIGHADGDGAFLPADAGVTADTFAAYGIARGDVLAMSGNKDIVVVLDTAPAAAARKQKPLPATAVVLSSSSGVLLDERRPAFSYFVLGALRGWADASGDGNVSVDEAFRYASAALRTVAPGASAELGGRTTPWLVLAANASERGPDVAALVRARASSQMSAAPSPAASQDASTIVEAEAVFRSFDEIVIVSPNDPRAFKMSLTEKRRALDRVAAAFAPHTKVPEERAAAECRTGEARLAMANAIDAVTAPRGLTEEQVKIFREKLAETARPLVDVALSDFKACAEGRDAWARRCAAHVASLRAPPVTSADGRVAP